MNINQFPVVIKEMIPTAPLPLNYEAVKRAIAECLNIDQCAEWGDKAVALASYARQARDDSLKHMAVRIQLRADARAGELLLAIPRAHCGRGRPNMNRIGADVDPNSRTQIGKRAGMGSTRVTEAMQIGSIPRAERNKLIEQSPPPGRRALAALGRPLMAPYHNHHQGRFTSEAYREIGVPNGLTRFSTWALNRSASDLARRMTADEAQMLRALLKNIEEWLDEFEQHLPKAKT